MNITVGRVLLVNLWKGYCDSNKVVVTFWKFLKTLGTEWKNEFDIDQRFREDVHGKGIL